MKPRLQLHLMKWTILSLCVVCATFKVAAQSYTITNSAADAMLSGASPTLNFGAAGTLAISPASSPKGEFDTVLMFNTAGAVSQFNSTYGAGNWAITGLMLSLASNFGTNGANPGSGLLNNVSGGNFGIDWLVNDGWAEGAGGGNGTNNGAVSFNSIPSLLASGFSSLGTYTYTPPGNNVYANYSLSLDGNLVADAMAGSSVSLYFFAADNQVGYLFNSRQFASNHPQLTLTVAPIPEPATTALLAASLGGFLFWRRRTSKQ
jgi:hypothetical protein